MVKEVIACMSSMEQNLVLFLHFRLLLTVWDKLIFHSSIVKHYNTIITIIIIIYYNYY